MNLEKKLLKIFIKIECYIRIFYIRLIAQAKSKSVIRFDEKLSFTKIEHCLISE